MLRALAVLSAAAITLAVLLGLLVSAERRYAADASGSLMLYCAASNSAVIEHVRRDYEARYQQPIQVQYGASQTLLSSLQISRSGDLYLPADDSYLQLGRDKDLIAQTFPIARMHAVLAIRQDNPRQIHGLDDLLRDDVRFVQAHPESAAIGQVSQAALTTAGRWPEIAAATLAFRATVNEVANDVQVGSADAGIVYDAVLHTYPELTSIELPELADAVSQVSIGLLTRSTRPQAAADFARYLSAADGGQLHYAAFGFHTRREDDSAP